MLHPILRVLLAPLHLLAALTEPPLSQSAKERRAESANHFIAEEGSWSSGRPWCDVGPLMIHPKARESFRHAVELGWVEDDGYGHHEHSRGGYRDYHRARRTEKAPLPSWAVPYHVRLTGPHGLTRSILPFTF
jgi:hypothetical protein